MSDISASTQSCSGMQMGNFLAWEHGSNMPTKVTTTITTEIKLSATLKRKLLTELRTFENLHKQARALKHAIQGRKDIIQKAFETADEFDALIAGTKLEGFSMKYIAGERKVLDKGILIDLGVSQEMLDEATVSKKIKPYMKISAPGEKEDEE